MKSYNLNAINRLKLLLKNLLCEIEFILLKYE